jgi:hypothetical protein
MNSITNQNPITNQNLITNTNILGSIIGIIIFLITLFLSFYYIFKTPSKKVNYTSRASNTGFAILFVVLIGIFIGGLFFGMFKGKYSELLNVGFLSQFTNVGYVVLYTIFLIIFFRIINSDIENRPNNNWAKYVDYITPISILVTALLFYKGFSSDFTSQYNITYERIKMMILLFCFIAVVITYNSIAPGNFITDYYGSSLVITILLGIFGFLYLLVLLTVPDTSALLSSEAPTNFLNYFSKYSSLATAGLIVFIIVSTIGITMNKQKLIDNKLHTGVIISVLLTCILWGTFILYSKSPFASFFDDSQAKTTMGPYNKAILAVFGIAVSGCLIAWLAINIQSLLDKSTDAKTITSFILNLLLVLVILTIIYKTIYTELPYGNSTKNSFFDLLISVIFFIPCIFSNIYDFIMNTFIKDYNSATTGTFTLIIVMILLFLSIYILPTFEDTVILQGGKLLIDEPINTRHETELATYNTLKINLKDTFKNKITNYFKDNTNNYLNYSLDISKFDYRYALSFWVFLDSMPPSTNESYDKYTSILSYGGKPDILFNPSLNTILVTMKMKSVDANKFNILDIKETNYDDNYLIDNQSIVIVSKMENILLQKWNQFIINCDGGIIDIFYNNELVKSAIDIVPYMTMDNLTVGQERGIYGGVCNVVYYNEPLTITQMYYSYNTVKSSDPPITNKSNKTITKYLN